MLSAKKTAPSISGCVKEFMDGNNLGLDSVAVSLVCEKIFTDKKEYTVEVSERRRSDPGLSTQALESDIEQAASILTKILSLAGFYSFKVEKIPEGNALILKVSTPEKDGLLIGKNGQNILALQYLMSNILDKQLKKHLPIIIDVDRYREKRAMTLKTMVRACAGRASGSNCEVITEYLPSFERRIIHEEIAPIETLKTFSVGRGPYKKVVITPLL